MKLLTHNMLTSHVKGVKNGYPFAIISPKVELRELEFNGDFIRRMIKRLHWPVVKQAATTVGVVGEVPEEVPADYESNEAFLRRAHHLLLEVEVVEGQLECPESGQKFPITQGIPNLLLREEEED